MDFELRPWTMDDLDDLVAAANNFKIAKNMMDMFPHPYHQENGKAFIEMTMKASPPNIMAIVVEGKANGGIGIHPQHDVHRKNAELGYWLAEPFWGKGIVPKAVERMVKYAFDNFDITRIFARPFGTNKASQRVLEKAGFILEARFDKTIFKNNEYQDELVYAIRRPQIA
jgi:[ribosomal protein S5]-alanine N-acetyltransferase